MIYRQTKALIAGNYLPRHFIVNVAGNLAAFAPFALFLPVCFKKCRRFGVFFVVCVFLAVLLIVRHSANIDRLFKGTESKLSFKNAGKAKTTEGGNGPEETGDNR